MNRNLTAAHTEVLLEVLHRGLAKIRESLAKDDMARADELAQALHRIPHVIADPEGWGWTIRDAEETLLTPLVRRFPELVRQEPVRRATKPSTNVRLLRDSERRIATMTDSSPSSERPAESGRSSRR